MRVLAATLLAALVAPAGAMASSALPQGSPVEPLLSRIASGIAGGPVSVTCDGTSYSWALPGQIHLLPRLCDDLARYAAADTKPTMCEAIEQTTVTTRKPVRYRKTVRVKRHGKTIKKRVWRTRYVRVTDTVDRHTGQMVPCYYYTSLVPANYYTETGGTNYQAQKEYAEAIQTLAHEAIHTQDFRNGREPTETHAQCAGISVSPSVVVALGGTIEDGTALMRWYVDEIMPTMPAPYSTPC